MFLQSSVNQANQLGWRLILGYAATIFFGYAVPIWLFHYKVNPIEEIAAATRMIIATVIHVVRGDADAAMNAAIAPIVAPQFWLVYGRYGLVAGVGGAAILLITDFVTFSLSAWHEVKAMRMARRARRAVETNKTYGKADAAGEGETSLALGGKPTNQGRPKFDN